MTDSELHGRLVALLEQRAVALARGLPNTVAALDREIHDLTRHASPPAARAATR